MTHVMEQRSVTLLAEEGGGAELGQVVGLGVTSLFIAAIVLWVGYSHRTRRITWLTAAADRVGARFNRPGWVALPLLIFVPTLILALFGFIWDVSFHAGNGRDPGPLANPAHYFIIVPLGLLFIAGALACVLPFDKPGPAAVRITGDWYAPVGGIVMALCGLFALIGFPLDDVWHRLFGQDVTLWGPTHLMLITGAGVSTLSALMLEWEGRCAAGPDRPRDGTRNRLVQFLGAGSIAIGLSVYQVEFDFSIQQFRQVFQPMLMAAAAAFAFVIARLVFGRGAAVASAAAAIVIRLGVALVVGPVLGSPISWFPIYLGAAILVELLGLTGLIRRPVLFGAVAGLVVGTAGLWLESLWVNAVYAFPWPTSLWPEALAMAIPVAILTGVCGSMVGMAFSGIPLPGRAFGVTAVALTVVALGLSTGAGLRYAVPHQDSAHITLTPATGDAADQVVEADVRIPAALAGSDPNWVTIMSWQGGIDNDRGVIIDQLRRVGPGHYVSTKVVPVSGHWKTLLRVANGSTLTAVPIFLPADPAIGVPEVPAEATIDRPFVNEPSILQRERNPDAPASLWLGSCVAVLVLGLGLIVVLTWSVARIGSATQGMTPAITRHEDPLPV